MTVRVLRWRSISLATALAVLTIVSGLGAGPSESVRAAWPGLDALDARDDFAGWYRDHNHKTDVYLFTGMAPDAILLLEDHYRDASRFAVRTVSYSVAELEVVRTDIIDRLEELRADGLDIREVGTDVARNRVDVGAYVGLTGVREAFAEYGDKVRVFWSEGASTGPEPVHGTAVEQVDDVKVRLTLDDYPLVAGKPTWITTKVKNVGDTEIMYTTDSCENAVGVWGAMVDERWRMGEPADVQAIEAGGRNRYNDLRWRALEWTTAGNESIGIGFAPRSVPNADEWVCADVAIGHRVPPGAVVEQRLRWDGQALGRLGPPPDGLARITGSFDYRRPGTRGTQTVEVELEAPVTEGRDPDWLHPMELVDAALSDDDFRTLIEPVDIGDHFGEVISFDADREVWVVGACADYTTKLGRWKAAVLDPATGEVRRILNKVTGRHCYEGPWK